MPPRKKKPRKKKKEQPTVCRYYPHCVYPPVHEGFCIIHAAHSWFAGRARQTAERGEVAESLLSAGASFILQHLGQNAVHVVSGRPQPQHPAIVDPFEVLGLDRQTATEKDVRRVQRALAKLYHDDLQAPGVSSKKMAQINDAAKDCLESIKKGR